MRFCENCRIRFKDDRKFCSNCGHPTSEAEKKSGTGGTPHFCDNCGEPLNQGEGFCPNCGTRVEELQGAPWIKLRLPKLHFGKGALIGIACVAAAAVIALLIGLGAFRSGADRFIDYQRDLCVDPAVKFISGAVGQVSESGKYSDEITLSAELSSADNGLSDYFEDLSLVLQIDKDSSTAVGVDLEYDGSPLVTGTVTYEDGTLGVYSPQLTGSYYTVDLSEYFDEGENLSAALSGMDSSDVSDTLYDIINAFGSAVNKDNLTVKKNVQVELEEAGGTEKCTAYIWRPSAADLEAAFNAVADVIEKDETIRALATQYMAFIPYYDGDEAASYIEDFCDGLREDGADMSEEWEDADFTWTVYAKGGRVAKIELGSDDEKLVYESAGKLTGGRTDVVYYDDGYDAFALKNTMTLSGKELGGTLTLDTGDGKMRLGYTMNVREKSSLGICYGTYKLKDYMNDVNFTLEVGKAENGGTDHTLTVKNAGELIWDLQYIGVEDLEINLHTADKSQSVDQPGKSAVDLTEYSEDEIYEVLGEMEDNFSDLMRDVFG